MQMTLEEITLRLNLEVLESLRESHFVGLQGREERCLRPHACRPGGRVVVQGAEEATTLRCLQNFLLRSKAVTGVSLSQPPSHLELRLPG